MLDSHNRAASISTPTLYTSTSLPASPFVQVEHPPAQATASNARPTHKARRPSISNTMSKLKDSLTHTHIIDGLHLHNPAHKRAHSSSRVQDGPYAAKSLQISEPTLTGSLDHLGPARFGPLGSGATVVRTPQEALSSTRSSGSVSASSAGPYRMQASTSAPSRIHQYTAQPEPVAEEDAEFPSPPRSPALPPLPASPSPRTQYLPLQPQAQVQSQMRKSAASASSQARSSGRVSTRVFPAQPPPPAATQLPMTPNASPQMPQRASLTGSSHSQRASSSKSRPSTSGSGSARDSSRSSRSSRQSVAFLSADLLNTPAAPPFAPVPVLMSNLPSNMHRMDTSKVIITLETSTSALKTSLRTLTAVPSHLATYLIALVTSTSTSSSARSIASAAQTPAAENDAESVYSQKSEFHDSDDEDGIDDSRLDDFEAETEGFNSLFREHLASAGLATPAGLTRGRSMKSKVGRRADKSAAVHVFLDRPSAPYAHILSYLRSAPSPDAEETAATTALPYGARLFHGSSSSRFSISPARLDALLELRDEAAFLRLADLQRLCEDELAGAVALATAAEAEAAEEDAKRASVHSTHTLCEPHSASDVEKQMQKQVQVQPPVAVAIPAEQTVEIPVALPISQPASPVKYAQNPQVLAAAQTTPRARSRQGVPSDIPRGDSYARGHAHTNSSTSSLYMRATSPGRNIERAKPIGNYF